MPETKPARRRPAKPASSKKAGDFVAGMAAKIDRDPRIKQAMLAAIAKSQQRSRDG